MVVSPCGLTEAIEEVVTGKSIQRPPTPSEHGTRLASQGSQPAKPNISRTGPVREIPFSAF